MRAVVSPEISHHAAVRIDLLVHRYTPHKPANHPIVGAMGLDEEEIFPRLPVCAVALGALTPAEEQREMLDKRRWRSLFLSLASPTRFPLPYKL